MEEQEKSKYFTPDIEDIKQRLINDNTLGVTISEKLDLMLSFDHNIKDIILKICKRINTLSPQSKI